MQMAFFRNPVEDAKVCPSPGAQAGRQNRPDEKEIRPLAGIDRFKPRHNRVQCSVHQSRRRAEEDIRGTRIKHDNAGGGNIRPRNPLDRKSVV